MRIGGKQDVLKLFLSRIYDGMREEEEKRRRELHLTDLTSDCYRQVWFDKHQPLPDDIESRIRMWEGAQLHIMPLTECHELKLSFEGVLTSIDEYDPESGILIEKKFVGFIPVNENELNKYYSHYIKQVEYEALFLEKNGKPVNKAFILFVCRGEPDQNRPMVNVFEIPIRDLKAIEARFREEVTILELILSSENPPDIPEQFAPFDYPCSYCKYRARCWSLLNISLKNPEGEGETMEVVVDEGGEKAE